MHRASVGRRAPANGLDRPSSHTVRHGILTKYTSPTFARSHSKVNKSDNTIALWRAVARESSDRFITAYDAVQRQVFNLLKLRIAKRCDSVVVRRLLTCAGVGARFWVGGALSRGKYLTIGVSSRATGKIHAIRIISQIDYRGTETQLRMHSMENWTKGDA
jgi:hypothetical protein